MYWGILTGRNGALFYQVKQGENYLEAASGGSLAPYDSPMKQFNDLEPGQILVAFSTKRIYETKNVTGVPHGIQRLEKRPMVKAGTCFVMRKSIYPNTKEEIENFKEQPTTSAGYIYGSSVGCRCSSLFWNPFEGMTLFE